jgi:hypothetical protein
MLLPASPLIWNRAIDTLDHMLAVCSIQFGSDSCFIVTGQPLLFVSFVLPAGALIWNRTIIEYVLAVDPSPYPSSYSNSSIISRTSPAVAGDVMVRHGLGLLRSTCCLWSLLLLHLLPA